VEKSEHAEILALAADTPEKRDAYGQEAIGYYLRALRWWPLEHVYQLPPPSDVGQHPADEQIFGELMWPTIPCILCGDPIPVAIRGKSDDGDDGRYCVRCKNF
jgi:hypothetical protein